jgi:hypothetical protein
MRNGRPSPLTISRGSAGPAGAGGRWAVQRDWKIKARKLRCSVCAVGQVAGPDF